MMGVDVSAQSLTAIISSLISDIGYKIRVLASAPHQVLTDGPHASKNGKFSCQCALER